MIFSQFQILRRWKIHSPGFHRRAAQVIESHSVNKPASAARFSCLCKAHWWAFYVVLSLLGFWSTFGWTWVNAGRHLCLSKPKGCFSAFQTWLLSFTCSCMPLCTFTQSAAPFHRAFDGVVLLGLFNDLLKLTRCLFTWQSRDEIIAAYAHEGQ